ncbi:hypothetical protein Ddc_03536 [Ditylenchus destructor]|nr:hypothetical protein Ddc_03536 [Ditylenchus destructor]
MAAMQWGMICSTPDYTSFSDLEEFGEWMVKELQSHGETLYISHRFARSARFVLHCKPGDRQAIMDTYERISREYADVIYVIHILPVKNSLEFKMLKELTINYALVGQGVLLEKALTKFDEADDLLLSAIFNNMNQYISRRLSQIICYRRSENSYNMVINGGNLNRHKLKYAYPDISDVSSTVEKVLHSSGINLHPASEDNAVTNGSSDIDLSSAVVVEGLPHNFNEFQIASIFSKYFRPTSVLCTYPGAALVSFSNKYHAAQVVMKLDKIIIDDDKDEQLSLKVTSACPSIQERLNRMQFCKREKAVEETVLNNICNLTIS